MSLFFRRPPQRSVHWSGGWVAPGAYLPPSGRGSTVTTMEQSLQVIAMRSCVDLICSLVSELPIDVMTGRGDTKSKIRTVPGYLDDPAGDGYGREDWLYMGLESALLRGNLYGITLAADRNGVPTQVDLQHPDRVRGDVYEGRPRWWINGALLDDPQLMFHRRVNPIPGSLVGLSPVTAHAADLGLSIAMVDFGKDYFDNGANPGAVVYNEEKSIENESTAKAIKRRFMESLRGREPVVLGKGWKFQPIAVNPEESQFLESRQFTGSEVCHIFGPGIAEILGYAQPGSTLTYANVTDRSVHLLVYALNRWIRRAERWLSAMLPRPQSVRMDRDALLESTTLQRYQAHASALQNKWKLPNEVRADEDLEPIPGGDQVIDKQPEQPAVGAGAASGGSNG